VSYDHHPLIKSTVLKERRCLVHVTNSQVSVVIEGRFIYPSGVEEPFSFDVKLDKKIDVRTSLWLAKG
jgi:hypothetical protein